MVIIMWRTAEKTGRAPGRWGSTSDAEREARGLLDRFPSITDIELHYDRQGFIRALRRS
jgi:hypothetical protein